VGYQTNWWRDEREQASLVISCAAFHRKGSLLRAESIVGMAREA
jgi:hypothetical protein